MTRNELTISLIRAGLYSGAWALDDDTYEPVSREFVSAAMVEFPSFLPPELRTLIDVGGGKKLTAPRWLPEVWDCDNLARAFAVYLGICLARDAVLTFHISFFPMPAPIRNAWSVIRRWLAHYTYALFAKSFNGATVALDGFLGLAAGATVSESIAKPNWQVAAAIFCTAFVRNALLYLKENPLPAKLPAETEPPFVTQPSGNFDKLP